MSNREAATDINVFYIKNVIFVYFVYVLDSFQMKILLGLFISFYVIRILLEK